MNEPFLQIRGIRKEYGPVVAVHDVNLDVRRGEFLTFLGPSGSGKSTTLYILAGFENPTKGDITLEGKTLLATPSHKRNIGMVFQRYTLFPHLTVGENIAFPLKVRRKSRAEIDSKVKGDAAPCPARRLRGSQTGTNVRRPSSSASRSPGRLPMIRRCC